jgi:hypothetical protein
LQIPASFTELISPRGGHRRSLVNAAISADRCALGFRRKPVKKEAAALVAVVAEPGEPERLLRERPSLFRFGGYEELKPARRVCVNVAELAGDMPVTASVALQRIVSAANRAGENEKFRLLTIRRKRIHFENPLAAFCGDENYRGPSCEDGAVLIVKNLGRA